MPLNKDQQIKQAIFSLTESVIIQQKQLKEMSENLKNYSEAVKILGLILKELDAKKTV